MLERLSDEIYVAPQIGLADVPWLAGLGFRSILCNRPDGEAAGQPPFSEVERAAASVGLVARFVPVPTVKVTDADLAAFAAAYEALPKPILAYCRSGTRSTTLWNLARSLLPRPTGKDAQ